MEFENSQQQQCSSQQQQCRSKRKHCHFQFHQCNQPQCSLLFFNPKKLEFVSYEGQSKQITQSDAKHVWWREWLRLFYPEGPDGSRFSVWELRPEKVQLVSGGKGLESTREDWQSPELRLNHSTKLWERVDVK